MKKSKFAPLTSLLASALVGWCAATAQAATPAPASAPSANVCPAILQHQFHKYLIDRNGKVLASFASDVAPNSKALVSAIEKAL